MDELDRRILEHIQRGFPVQSHPFLKIANKFGISELEAFRRIRSLKKNEVIRRIGAVIDAEKLDARRALIACKIEPGRVEEIAEFVNLYDEVTHNYLREGAEFNLWFTVVAKDKTEFERVVEEIRKIVGRTNFLFLGAVRTFKIQAVFESDIIGSADEKAERD